MKSYCLFIMAFLLCLVSCAKENPDSVVATFVEIPKLSEEQIADIQYRARQIADIKWKTTATMPGALTDWGPGTRRTGIPYSSAKEIGGFVGFDVSFYTFLSAVHNPRSVLYTEDLSKPPYIYANCRTYYGTVCSTTVEYALGFDLPYRTTQFPELDFFHELPSQELDSLQVGDLMWKSGHVFMIYDFEYDDDGMISRVATLESVQNGTYITWNSVYDFNQRWETQHLIAYRCSDIKEGCFYYEPIYNSLASFAYYDGLCPNKGDRSVYDINTPVIINVLDEGYTNLAVIQGDKIIYDTGIGSTHDVSLTGLSGGAYQAYAYSEARRSEPISFEVIDWTASVQNKGKDIAVFFSSSYGNPEYIRCTSRQGSAYETFPITADDISRGYKIIPKPKYNAAKYVRVIFRSDYGTIHSSYIPI